MGKIIIIIIYEHKIYMGQIYDSEENITFAKNIFVQYYNLVASTSCMRGFTASSQ